MENEGRENPITATWGYLGGTLLERSLRDCKRGPGPGERTGDTVRWGSGDSRECAGLDPAQFFD